MQPVWIEIPVVDLERAMKFYQTLFRLEPTEISTEDVRHTTTLYYTPEGGPGISLNQTQQFRAER